MATGAIWPGVSCGGSSVAHRGPGSNLGIALMNNVRLGRNFFSEVMKKIMEMIKK